MRGLFTGRLGQRNPCLNIIHDSGHFRRCTIWKEMHCPIKETWRIIHLSVRAFIVCLLSVSMLYVCWARLWKCHFLDCVFLHALTVRGQDVMFTAVLLSHHAFCVFEQHNTQLFRRSHVVQFFFPLGCSLHVCSYDCRDFSSRWHIRITTLPSNLSFSLPHADLFFFPLCFHLLLLFSLESLFTWSPPSTSSLVFSMLCRFCHYMNPIPKLISLSPLFSFILPPNLPDCIHWLFSSRSVLLWLNASCVTGTYIYRQKNKDRD